MIEINKITEVCDHIEGLSAVIFDLDDTLYSEKEYVRSGFRAVATMIPYVKDAEIKLWKAFDEKKPAIDTLLNEEGIYSAELKNKCMSAYRTHKPDLHLYEGVERMLAGIRENGCKIGIITDGRPEGQKAKIKALSLEKRIDHIIITDELGGVQYRKPCERAYRIMKNCFEVDFEEMCYVGDNRRKDFIAAEKLGMKSIWFSNLDGLYYREAVVY